MSVIEIYSKYRWVTPLKDKTGITIINTFQKILDESGCKPKTIRVNKSSEFCSRSMKSWLQDNEIEIYSTQNEGKSVVAKKFIRNVKNKIYKYKSSVSKNIDKFDIKFINTTIHIIAQSK